VILVDALGPSTELLHVLLLPDFDRVDRIGSYWGNPATDPDAGSGQRRRNHRLFAAAQSEADGFGMPTSR